MGNLWKFFVTGILLLSLCDGGKEKAGKDFSISFSLRDCSTLKVIYIKVPVAVVQGHKAILKCAFDLEGDKLYSVKWYRGAGEFYRYTPSETNPIKKFKIKGFHVIEDESNATQVVLEHVSRAISGPFSCEVTADGPSFFTDMKTADLEVVKLPKDDPYITGLKTRYKIGDLLKTNCTSEKSSPAANVAWYVNGQHVDNQHVHKHKYNDGEYITSYATLRLKITEKLLENGKLKIRCSASMHNIYHRSSEKSIELEKKKNKAIHARLDPTTSELPLENWQFVNGNPSESTLIFYAPINSLAGPRIFYEAILLVTASVLVTNFR